MQRLIFMLFLLALAACTTAPKRVEPEPATKPTVAAPVTCIDCGVVQDIRSVTSTNTAPPKKPVLSGIVGGVVSAPSNSKKAITRYEILIQMLNGKKVLVTQTLLSSGLRIGSKVRVSQGRILAVGP